MHLYIFLLPTRTDCRNSWFFFNFLQILTSESLKIHFILLYLTFSTSVFWQKLASKKRLLPTGHAIDDFLLFWAQGMCHVVLA